MKNDETEKVRYNRLLQRVRELEMESDSRAERAEEVMLLTILGNTISNIKDKHELLVELLEKISVLKYLPLCCCYKRVENQYKLVASYVAPYFGQAAPTMSVNGNMLSRLNKQQTYCGTAKGVIESDFPLKISDKMEMMLIPFRNKWIEDGVFLFIDANSPNALSTKLMVIHQAISMVLNRIDKLEYITQIEQLNKDLEQRVLERTKALSETNDRLLAEIEERKKVEVELHLAKDKAQESDRLKSMFLANMSHEIRTPMNAIVGFSELMEGGGCSMDELLQYARIIYRNSLSLLNLINDLLDFSKIEANQLMLHYSTCNVNDILDDLVSLGSSLLNQYKKEHLNIEVGKPLPDHKALIYTDELRLRQILINLLSNAIKFSDEGSIQIKCQISGQKACFRVKDEGIGIAPNMHDIIFSRFSRLRSNANMAIAGNGLGLAITKRLVEMLGGKISVKSDIGKGSEFMFCVAANKKNS